ncbi:hypothetical protein BOTCAL_0338g00050 [Botryotinia calthae]|uniref:Peptidase S8/S53 domain-containing protein n=1 Tax=Botryotinia calthae TaxID=38488 RepID=A0A4Y8CVN3_9HELO|nr:hypothetical protein BOTCAL_0338g00050 [Botryotinia calthae]
MCRAIQPRTRGLSDLTVIFDWLRRNHVQKIMKVMVIDDGQMSHTDATIEDALSGFEVEVWEWKKLDLCSEGICNSSKVIREICLYSSGNSAVLMSWSSTEGLRDPKKSPEVRPLFSDSSSPKFMLGRASYLLPHPNSGKFIFLSGRLRECIDIFEGKLNNAPAKDHAERINFKYRLDNETVSYTTIPDKTASLVKDAIIDEGVEAALGSLDAKSSWANHSAHLETAVSAVGKEDIVMFCSASDQGSSSTRDKLAWVHGQKADFLLPGENIPFQGADETLASGSSVATAATSGLAASLIYCKSLVTPSTGRYFNQRTRMREAIAAISNGSAKQFPRVQNFCSHRLKDYVLQNQQEHSQADTSSRDGRSVRVDK